MLNCVSMIEELVEFLEKEMKKRGWSQADFARATGMTTGGVSMLMNQSRRPSPETLLSIADAINFPPVHLFMIAGMLPKDIKRIEDKDLLFLFNQLSPGDKEEIEELIRFKLERKRAVSKKKTALSV